MSIKKLAKGLKDKEQRPFEHGKEYPDKSIRHEKKGKALTTRSVPKQLRQKGSGRGR